MDSPLLHDGKVAISKDSITRFNVGELSIQRRKRILGSQLHAREFSRQKVEAMIGSGILNKMTLLGIPQSYRCA